MEELLARWNVQSRDVSPLESGLINNSFKVIPVDGAPLILQRINQSIFSNPKDLMANHLVISNHLADKPFDYQGPVWSKGTNGNALQYFEDAYWRLGIFYDETSSFETAEDADMAFEVGRAFGRYDQCLLELHPNRLKETIVSFHDLNKYLGKLRQTMDATSAHKLKMAKELLNSIDDFLFLTKKSFPKTRIIHNDAKITNLLFKEHSVVAVIDWDTTMAGHISWEYADLFRTVGVNVAEDHMTPSELQLEYDLIEALSSGFKSVLFDHLTDQEKQSLYYGSLYLIFEQAIRFIEDYLAGNVYYSCTYEEHNLTRSRNQFRLLSLMVKDKKAILKRIEQS